MGTNVEVKARINDWPAIQRIAESLSDLPVQIIEQTDTFFVCARGRLKLRRFSPDRGELIAYERGDFAATRTSSYHITPTTAPDDLRETLTRALGLRGGVTKRRLLYLVGQTRIHLDQVEGLGSFVELEVVLRPGQPAVQGQQITADLMARLGIQDEQIVPCAYIDLLEAPATSPTAP